MGTIDYVSYTLVTLWLEHTVVWPEGGMTPRLTNAFVCCSFELTGKEELVTKNWRSG